MTKIIALIAAAGVGLRFGEPNLPKQYQLIDGKSVLARTIEKFVSHPEITAVKVIIAQDHNSLYCDAIKNLNNGEKKILPSSFGGEERTASILSGLKDLQIYGPDIVLIHDGCRPFVGYELITNIIEATKIHGAAIPVLDSIDTLKEVENGFVKKTITRSKVFSAQTPQGFMYKELLELYMQNQVTLTDDALIYENSGKPVFAVRGEGENIKITTKKDLK